LLGIVDVYEMAQPPIPLEPRNDPYQQALKNISQIILKRLLHFESLPSTNAYLKHQGTLGEREGLIVLADIQTAGIGRLNRPWHSPVGGLYFSILLRPMTIKASEAPLITLTAGVAVAKVLQSALGLNMSLKWPNDVLIANKKVAGILTEATLLGDDIEYVVVGFGINANTALIDFPEPLQKTATTLQECLQSPVDMPRLFGYLIGQLEFWYIRLRDQGFNAIIPHYRRICTTLGKRVTIDHDDSQTIGLAKDIGPDGSLVIHTSSGRQYIQTGDVVSATLNKQNE
jgi:biotin-[acetyl-CoA-carboxylase] ligase BirA-like protein